MNLTFSARSWRAAVPLGLLALFAPLRALSQAASPPSVAPAAAPPQGSQTLPSRITLDEAIDLALKHNHSLQAARTTILQNQAMETTANLRPNPTILGDAQFLPFFQPNNFSDTYLDNTAQFDVGVSYLFERGKKRQHRLEAAKDATAVTSAQVDDNARTLTFNVASQFVGALLAQSELDLANQDLASFQKTVDISQASFNAGSMSGGDLLKIKIQMLQFQMDVSSARLARIQALASLRQLLGYESVPENYEVIGDLEYKPVKLSEDDLKMMALKQRPDVRAAQLGVTAASSQYTLAKADGKQDITGQVNYTHIGLSELSLFASMPLPIFNRNQGEIARTRYAIAQSQELSSEQSSIALTDVANSYEGLRTADEVVSLYQSGYLKQAEDSRDISQYAYQHGAASLLDFLDAERSYRSTELAYRQALANYMTSLEQLRQSVGTRSLP
jgi:cobalt-zinc-cadmium efflux system outer membrane protein